MFYENFIKACENSDTTPSAVLKTLNLSTGNMQNWKDGATIKSDILLKIALHLNATTDYLLTGKDTPNTLSNNELELLQIFRQLPEDREQQRFLGKAELIAQEILAKAENADRADKAGA